MKSLGRIISMIMINIYTVHGAYIYTKLDIQWGYNSVCIKEGDKHKAVFKTCYGLFKLTIMFLRFDQLTGNFPNDDEPYFLHPYS